MPRIAVSRGLVDFALGAALITVPQHKVLLAAGVAVVNIVRRIQTQRASGSASASEHDSDDSQEIHLSWSQINCSITSKKGARKELLVDVAGEAAPGR